MPLPTRGLPRDEIERRLAAIGQFDLPTHGGRTYAYVYDSGVEGLDDLAAQAYRAFSSTNGLDPTVFPSVAVMENEVVGIVADLVGGGPAASGMVTSGGTESCMLAVKAARDRWRRSARSEGGRGELVLPVTAHAAFAKAAHYFDMDRIVLPVDGATFSVEPASVAAAVSQNTALVVVSAPSYAHGVLDPVAEVAAVAGAADVPCHVDSCIGGMLLPFLRRVGVDLPPFGLDVPGVTSISVDLHKYGYTPKGASVLLFADARRRQDAYFAFSAWPGYPVVNPTMQSTRSAGPLAAAWTVLHALGDEGYLELARSTRAATDTLIAEVSGIGGLRVLGRPATSLVAVAGEDGVDPLVVADLMREKGWYVQPQLAYSGLPRNIHFTVTAVSGVQLPGLLADLRECVAGARRHGPAEADPQLAALAAQLDPEALTAEQVDGILAFAGLDPTAAPTETSPAFAPVLALIEALPEALRERLLGEYLSRIFTAVRS